MHGLVPVLIPTYGRPEMLRGAIQSVLRQTYSPMGLLVGSDRDPQAEPAIKALAVDPRLRIQAWEKNRGQFAANEDLLKACHGDCVFSEDDLMEPRFLERCVEDLSTTGADYIYAYQFLREESRLTFRCGMNMNAAVFTRACLERVRTEYGSVFSPQLRQCADAVLLERLRNRARA